MTRAVLAASACLFSCSEVLVQPNDGGGGSDDGAVTASTATQGSSAASTSSGGAAEGGGGAGGGPIGRTIEVDATIPSHADPAGVVVTVSTPDGTVSNWWTGDQLPVDAPATDGDLVTFAYLSGATSIASSYRVTPAVTKVTKDIQISPPPLVPCPQQAPMTVTLVIPAVDGANSYHFVTSGGVNGVYGSPGSITHEVSACAGIVSFDILGVASEFANTDPLAFARVDGVPYVPGSSVEIPFVFSTERLNVDIVVTAAPGTAYRASGASRDQTLGLSGNLVSTSTVGVVGPGGTDSLSYGPFASGGEWARVSVSTPPSFFCEMETATRITPFDGSVFEVTPGLLAPFAPTADGNVAIGGTGEVGDVLVRVSDQFTADPQRYWEVHEDPTTPQPLPAHPTLPPGLLPDFAWPSGVASVMLLHRDDAGVAGYADFTSSGASGADTRSLRRLPEECP